MKKLLCCYAKRVIFSSFSIEVRQRKCYITPPPAEMGSWHRMSSSLERYGIIRTLPSGIPQWIEAVQGLAEAKASLMRLASKEPGEFFIYSETSGMIVERFVCVETQQEDADTKEQEQPAVRFACLSQPPGFLN